MSYEKIRTLGSGGFGTVILAREIISERLVAIKKLKIEDSYQQNEIIRETRILSSFSHPNIVTYYHAYEEDGLVNLVMEYCENGSLLNKVNHKPLPIIEALTTVIKIAKAMEVVHEKGIIHHDIKPANLLLDADNNIKIGDFGIANQGGGTRDYLAPEYFLYNSKDIDGIKLDVYALGVTFLEILNGEFPFDAVMKEEILEDYVQKDLLNGFPIWLKEIIIKTIHPDPSERFPNMKMFYQRLEQRNIPNIITKKVIETGKLAAEIERLIKRMKWGEAEGKIKYGITNMSSHPKLLYQAGRFFMKKNNLAKAKSFFEVIKKKATIINIDKELGWISLHEKNYNEATSYLSDYIQQNPNDIEAYNLLLECFYQSGLYDLGCELGNVFRKNFPANICFKLNVALFSMIIHGNTQVELTFLKDIKDNPLYNYNISVFNEKKPSWGYNSHPTMKSKLLFCDYQFVGAQRNPFLEISINEIPIGVSDDFIITIGRDGYDCNTIQLDGINISRRHCLIFNTLNNVWLYDLDSYLGTYVDETLINNRMLLYGKVRVKVGDNVIDINTDKRRLF